MWVSVMSSSEFPLRIAPLKGIRGVRVGIEKREENREMPTQPGLALGGHNPESFKGGAATRGSAPS
jgi:hypothetical protein